MPWLISTDPAQQLLYAPDAGRALVALTRQRGTKAYEVVNVGGAPVLSVRSWLEQIAEVAGGPAKISVVLNDAKFHQALPDFSQTPMEQAIADTLAWFKANGANAPANRDARRQARMNTASRVAVNLLAIALVPTILALIATQAPILDAFVTYVVMAAGIYGAPRLHRLSNRLRGRGATAA